MTQTEYNAKLQEMQRMWPGCANRVCTDTDSKTGRIHQAYFQIYLDGQWHTLGRQHDPFTPEATYEWWDDLEHRLCGAFAGALMHS